MAKQQNMLVQVGGGIQAYSSAAAQVAKSEALALDEGYRELRRALRPVIGWRRAVAVAWHLRQAAEKEKAACAHATGAYVSYAKNFQPSLFNLRGGKGSRAKTNAADFFGS